MSLKRYVGHRGEDGALLVEVEIVEDGKAVSSYPLPHVVVHSPTGFECGYGGSGPADLALAILVDFFGESAAIPPSAYGNYDPSDKTRDAIGATQAWALHQDFKQDIIACLPQDDEWSVQETDIQAWLRYRRALERRRPREGIGP